MTSNLSVSQVQSLEWLKDDSNNNPGIREWKQSGELSMGTKLRDSIIKCNGTWSNAPDPSPCSRCKVCETVANSLFSRRFGIPCSGLWIIRYQLSILNKLSEIKRRATVQLSDQHIPFESLCSSFTFYSSLLHHSNEIGHSAWFEILLQNGSTAHLSVFVWIC